VISTFLGRRASGALSPVGPDGQARDTTLSFHIKGWRLLLDGASPRASGTNTMKDMG